jgi:hypothetical protein
VPKLLLDLGASSVVRLLKVGGGGHGNCDGA